jgi:hypothetical protein
MKKIDTEEDLETELNIVYKLMRFPMSFLASMGMG